jgi:hypothetical protein
MLDSDAAAAAKLELSRDGTPSSIESSPEREGEPEALQEPAQPLKRKGGRKPVCCHPSVAVIYKTILQVVAPLKVLNCSRLTIGGADICYLGRAQAEKSTSPGRFQREANRVHQATRSQYQTE